MAQRPHGAWYLLLPNGAVRRWLGTSKLTDNTLIATVTLLAYDNPQLLWGA